MTPEELYEAWREAFAEQATDIEETFAELDDVNRAAWELFAGRVNAHYEAKGA